MTRAAYHDDGRRRRRPAAESPQAQGGGAASPRAVTRGESQNRNYGVIIDWLNATFEGEGVEVGLVLDWLELATGLRLSAIEGGGLHGFERAYGIFAHHEAEQSAMGFVAMGGVNQRGRWLLQLTGAGCSLVRDWAAVHTLLFGVVDGARITRVDLAKDFLSGQFSVLDVRDAYEHGDAFTLRGRRPSSRLEGDWIGVDRGRTFYVGRAKNGKMLRVYEKGRQLGDPASEWTRFEVQLGSRGRDIPADVLLVPGPYFAGAYPYLAEIVEAFPELIPTTAAEGEITLARLVSYMRQSYGRVVNAALRLGADPQDLIAEVRLLGLPRRLNLSHMASGVGWLDIAERFHLCNKEGG